MSEQTPETDPAIVAQMRRPWNEIPPAQWPLGIWRLYDILAAQHD